MIAGKISYKYIMDKLYRDLGVNEELPEEDIISWVGEALLFVGAFSEFDSATRLLTVNNHQAPLPKDFYKLQEIAHNNKVMYWVGNTLINNWCCPDAKVNVCRDCEGVPHSATFYIDNYVINTGISDGGQISLTYLSMGVDEDGFPLIPNDVYFFEACKFYVIKQLDWKAWRKGNLPDKVYQDSQAKWDFYVQAARGSANMMDAQKMESMKERLIRFIPDQSAYQNFFRRNPEQKFLK